MKHPTRFSQNNHSASCWNPEPGPSSVLELLRPEDRERLLSIRSPSTQAAPLQAASPGGGGAGAVSSGLQQEALAAWKGIQTSTPTFRPFEKNPSKQARYELYLSRLRQGEQGETGGTGTRGHGWDVPASVPHRHPCAPSASDALEQSLDPAMTEWERSREQEEFVRASILYRPSRSSLSSRFTRAQHQEDLEGLEGPQHQENQEVRTHSLVGPQQQLIPALCLVARATWTTNRRPWR